jgi:hypothetical protein
MRLHDVQFLGGVRRDDHPTFITTTFSCSWEDAGMVAEPISFVDHGRGRFGEIFTYDQDGRRIGTNVPLLQRIIADSTANFERFHSMGYFGTKRSASHGNTWKSTGSASMRHCHRPADESGTAMRSSARRSTELFAVGIRPLSECLATSRKRSLVSPCCN